MSDIPDDVVMKGLNTFWEFAHVTTGEAAMRHAGRVFVEWERARANPPSQKELAIAARAHEPTIKCAKCGVVSYNIAPWCGNPDCPGRSRNLPAPNPDDCNPSDYT
jgi:hypothetical protein